MLLDVRIHDLQNRIRMLVSVITHLGGALHRNKSWEVGLVGDLGSCGLVCGSWKEALHGWVTVGFRIERDVDITEGTSR